MQFSGYKIKFEITQSYATDNFSELLPNKVITDAFNSGLFASYAFVFFFLNLSSVPSFKYLQIVFNRNLGITTTSEGNDLISNFISGFIKPNFRIIELP